MNVAPQQQAWIPAPGGGLVRNPGYVPPIANNWQQMQSSTGGLVRPGAQPQTPLPQQPVQQPQQQAPQAPAQQQPAQRPPLSMGTNYGAGINGANITTGIDAGPVYNPQQVQGALQRFKDASAAPMPQLGLPTNAQQQADLSGRYAGSMGYQAQNLGTDAEREMAFGNAQQLLASQRGRAQAGTQWGNLAARLGEIGSAEDILRRNSSLSLLGALGIL